MKKKFLVTAVLAAAVMLAACGGKKENEGENTPAPSPSSPAASITPAAPEGIDAGQQLQNIYQAVQEAYDTAYGPEMQVQGESYFMQDTLKLETTWYDHAVVEVPMMTMSVDTFAIIHATEGNIDKVAAALKAYQDYLINDSFQYPMNLPKVQSSLTGTVGDYAYFIILSGLARTDDVDGQLPEGSEEELLSKEIEAYQASNQVAVDTIKGVINGDIQVTPWTDLQKIHNKIKRAYGENYWPSVQRQDDEDYMRDVLKLDPAWCDDVIVDVAMISAHADMLVLVDASEGNLENVKNALDAYKEYLINESLQYPMNAARVRGAVVDVVGDYVCFSILGGVLEDDSWVTSEEELIEYYEAVSRNAIYAIQNYAGIFE